ncbi:MAG TPA: hypothetical protein VIH89_02890 [Candidatus Sulfotelmatobacter sp.]
MDDSKKTSPLRVFQALIPIVGIGIAVISLLLTVAARRKELTCTETSSTRLVSENLGGIDPSLHVEFGGQPVVTLSKLTFSLRNTGAAAIKGSDVIEPVRLQFAPPTKILSAVVEHTSPQRFGFATTSSPSSGEVVLTFSLLNSGDEAQFSIYVLNSEIQKPLFLGRVVDVTQMLYVDSTYNAPSNAGILPRARGRLTRSILRWFLSSVLWGISAVLLGFWIGGAVEYVRYLPWKRKYKPLYDDLVRESVRKLREETQPKTKAASAPRKLEEPGEPDDALVMRELSEEVALNRMMLIDGFRHPDVALELKKRGVPDHPHPLVGSFSGLVGFSAALLSIAFCSALTGLIVNEALRS